MSDRRQRQKEQRAAKRESERKQEARKELGRRITTAVVFGIVVVGIFVVGGLFRSDTTARSGPYEAFREQPTACGASQPDPETVMTFGAPENQVDINSSTEVTATLTTSCGEIVIALNNADSPETVNSFVFLARQGYYDGQVIHRVFENFVFQGGDPEANGTGGPGYVVSDEFPDDGFVYEEGVVAMANRGARSTGSQFFVVTGEDGRFLTNSFSVLGTVVSGQPAIDAIMAVDTAQSAGGEKSLPLESIYIDSIEIEVSGS